MGDTPIPETVESGSSGADSGRTTADPDAAAAAGLPPGDPGSLAPFDDVARALQKTSPVIRRDLQETAPASALDPKPDEDGTQTRTCEAADRSVETTSPAGAGKVPARGLIQAICRNFEIGLERGHSEQIEELLVEVEPTQRWELASRLMALEIRHRREAGDEPSLPGYLQRFPEHQALLKSVLSGGPAPARIDRFPVLGLLGSGAFGLVYLALDLQLDLLVAIKVPRPERIASPGFLDWFLDEARHAARINHPGIVRVYRAELDPVAGCYVVLEFIEGESLARRLENERLTPAKAAEIMSQTALGPSFAHEKGLVHRDLKPANILLDRAGRPHIADFGLALSELDRWLRRGEIAGTASYMAPEQVRGESHRLDGRTDIWALGVILYRMLTHVLPFAGSSQAEVFDEIRNREPVPPRQRDRSIPRGLERICLKCLSKRMNDRYATAADLAEDLALWIASPAADDQSAVPAQGAAPGNRSSSADLDPGRPYAAAPDSRAAQRTARI